MNQELITGRDFIVFGLQPWDFEMGSNCKNIAMEISRHNRVLYVNRPIERSTLYKFRHDHKIQSRLKSVRKGIDVLSEKQENIFVFNPRVILESINWLPEGKLYHMVSRLNARRFAAQINWAIKELNFKDPVFFIDNDFLKGFYLNDFVQASPLVYYIRDFLQSQPYFTRHGKKMEPAFMHKSDIVVANSSYLANYSRQFNPRSYDIGQGCELDGYVKDHHAIPADMKEIGGPVIGYVGALLGTRLDIGLLESIATRRPGWNFVLVGPEDEAFRNSALHTMKNVYFLGGKPVETLPAYVHHFDVCINPQLFNQMTIGNYPRKIDEYLAAGKPVVATATEAMEMFREFSFLAKDADGYIQGIEEMLKVGKDGELIRRRKEFAMGHTWEASVKGIYRAINAYKN